ncbi:TadE/TadG family type IV pilus assembly protein [Paenibacillus sp. 2TAB19]|uniref:TadE/TadG family type IV pilus assembly protein n=1 Tax=Paenibacillus sp. 2TAB19 TaxID=3233003 RepID=UPI003F9832A1
MRRLRLRNLLFREDGAVTVFAVIVLSSLLLFFAVLIDYARIGAIHKLAEDTVRSGVRSVLSAYDAGLYERYGLFARGGTSGQTIFEQVISVNMEEENGASSGFSVVDGQVESADLQTADVLGSHDIFARQVLEDMKYKAPIDFTLELVAKFAPMAGEMKEAAVAVDLLESMRRLYEKREAALALVLAMQEQAAAALGGSGMGGMIPVKASGSGGNGDTAAAIAGGFAAYAANVQHDESLQEDEEPLYAEAIAAYEQHASSLAGSLRRQSISVQQQHAKLKGKAFQELEAARKLNDEMKLLEQQVDAAANRSDYDAVGSHAERTGGERLPDSAASDIEEIKQSAKQMILPDNWFQQYKLELEGQNAAAAAFDMDAGRFQSNVSAAISRPVASSSSQTLMSAVAAMRLSYGEYEESYVQPATIIGKRRALLQDAELNNRLKEQESKAQSLWQQARNMLDGFGSVPQLEEHIKLYEEIQEKRDDNLKFNQKQSEAAQSTVDNQPGQAHEAAEQSQQFMGGLFTGMSGMLERSRDTIYYGEYIVDRYTVFAPQNLRAMLLNGDTAELSQAISFHNQEAEYVIYGFHNPIGNLAAAYGELFAVRMAIRTMEGLIQSRSLGHPLLILSAALIYGLEKTIEDMIAFTERGSAPLSKYVKTEVSYMDYLRLFMLVHSSDQAGMLSRMIAVIEQNTGTVLSASPSAVTGEAKLSMKLWFLPGAMHMVGKFGLLEGKVVGNRYETIQTIGSSY